MRPTTKRTTGLLLRRVGAEILRKHILLSSFPSVMLSVASSCLVLSGLIATLPLNHSVPIEFFAVTIAFLHGRFSQWHLMKVHGVVSRMYVEAYHHHARRKRGFQEELKTAWVSLERLRTGCVSFAKYSREQSFIKSAGTSRYTFLSMLSILAQDQPSHTRLDTYERYVVLTCLTGGNPVRRKLFEIITKAQAIYRAFSLRKRRGNFCSAAATSRAQGGDKPLKVLKVSVLSMQLVLLFHSMALIFVSIPLMFNMLTFGLGLLFAAVGTLNTACINSWLVKRFRGKIFFLFPCLTGLSWLISLILETSFAADHAVTSYSCAENASVHDKSMCANLSFDNPATPWIFSNFLLNCINACLAIGLSVHLSRSRGSRAIMSSRLGQVREGRKVGLYRLCRVIMVRAATRLQVRARIFLAKRGC